MPRELTTIEAARVGAFAVTVLELCLEHGGSVTSWQRTKKRNQDVGGRADSFHLEGLAADIELEDPERKPALVRDARAHGLDAGDEGDHVHVELDYRRPR